MLIGFFLCDEIAESATLICQKPRSRHFAEHARQRLGGSVVGGFLSNWEPG
uniref:Uncharacterized protein n=1 Tax=Pseudomonas aeruginosa TaxID=287 RepID=A0A7S6C712_PSEAI|nr:hypothetical protein [Pseudomonas aeruginosa]